MDTGATPTALGLPSDCGEPLMGPTATPTPEKLRETDRDGEVPAGLERPLELGVTEPRGEGSGGLELGEGGSHGGLRMGVVGGLGERMWEASGGVEVQGAPRCCSILNMCCSHKKGVEPTLPAAGQLYWGGGVGVRTPGFYSQTVLLRGRESTPDSMMEILELASCEKSVGS
ncbi:complexin-4 [Platysternon megacephalum]|uniref:Complexin-4 n=1 Tax=Platysternon megacephalum TaxID=55544 RepID=A0A4D9EMU1_9SAUR|nr:complexin-4 [Platysternon megacephalum]